MEEESRGTREVSLGGRTIVSWARDDRNRQQVLGSARFSFSFSFGEGAGAGVGRQRITADVINREQHVCGAEVINQQRAVLEKRAIREKEEVNGLI